MANYATFNEPVLEALAQGVFALACHTKWHKHERNLAVGDVVVTEDSSLPKNLWPIGVIKSVQPGDDGIVRSLEATRRENMSVCACRRKGADTGGGCKDVANLYDDKAEFLGL
jgi:Family of unknown function (DUF5641)